MPAASCASALTLPAPSMSTLPTLTPSRASTPLSRACSNSIWSNSSRLTWNACGGEPPSARRKWNVCVAVAGWEIRAVLDDAERANLVEHAELFHDRQVAGQQRLADVKTRVAVLFELDHSISAALQQRCRRGPGRTAADHEHIAIERIFCRRHAFLRATSITSRYVTVAPRLTPPESARSFLCPRPCPYRHRPRIRRIARAAPRSFFSSTSRSSQPLSRAGRAWLDELAAIMC